MTRPVKVISRWELFKRSTVWHPINTDPRDEDRSGPRFWYPTYDLIAIFLGVQALWLGSPLLNRLFPEWFTDSMGLVLIFAATICLFGVIFPRFVVWELIGKLAIVFMLGAYAGVVFFRSTSGEPNGFVVTILVMSVWLLGPRITKLFVQVPKTKALRKQRMRL